MRERPRSLQIPDSPGSYQFFDAHGRVLYVGKAKSLRSRLSNYFADPASLPPRTAQMVAAADHVEWIGVANEVEAILLEYALIKRHRPRFNIRLVDDKSYPYLAVTVSAEWPRAAVVRGRRRPGVRYFGPYAHVGALRDTLDLLFRSFGVRSCSDSKFERHTKLGKPCLLYHIERCSGPCIGAVDPQEYAASVEDLMAFFAGDNDDVEKRLRTEMEQAAEALDFERAARRRDQLATLLMATERQQVVTEGPEDLDVVGIEDDALEAAVCVFHVRRGRIVGRRAFVVDKVEELTRAQLVGRVLEQLYADAEPSVPEHRPRVRNGADGEGWASGAGDPATWAREPASAVSGVPRLVLVPEMPDDEDAYSAFLVDRRGATAALKVPMRGGKRALMETVTKNAREDLLRHRLRRASDFDSRTRALESLRRELGLAEAPLRIECYDMSHLQGTDYVGSMVVLEDGLPRKSEYRHFRLRNVAQNDDYSAMEEVLTRRLTALIRDRSASNAEASASVNASGSPGDMSGNGEASVGVAGEIDGEVEEPDGRAGGTVVGRLDDDHQVDEVDEVQEPDEVGVPKRPRRFAYPPQLLLLDGGKGQLGVGVKVLERLGLEDQVAVAALAKQFEEVYVPSRSEPIRIARGSDALFLLQTIRDEAHRFAISYHRKLRGRRMSSSTLEGIAGLGPGRRKRLLREMGSIKALRQASYEDIESLSWLPERVALAVYERLHEPTRPSRVRSREGAEHEDVGGR